MAHESRKKLAVVALVSALLGPACVWAQPPQPPPIDGIATPGNDFVLDNRDLVIRDSAGRVRIRLDAQSGDLRILDPAGRTVALIQQQGRNLWLGGGGRGGDLVLVPREFSGQDLANASVHIDGTDASQRLGGAGQDGKLVLRDGAGRQKIFLGGEDADLILGQEGSDGDIFVRDAQGSPTVTLDGATGRVGANLVVSDRARLGQIRSDHSSSAASEGIDTASVYLESANPALGLRDTTEGNTQGWLVQAGRDGALSFSPGDLGGLDGRVMVLRQDGGVCIGACD